MDLIDKVKKAIKDAENEKSKLSKDILEIIGMSSTKVRCLLNNLCHPKTNYLEIGTWQGSTLFSAAYENKGNFIGVDNFTKFGRPKKEFYENKEKFGKNTTFFEQNSWTVDLEKLPKIDVYFYDGAHSEENQYKAFTYFNPIFKKQFIAVIDDWNRPHIRRGTLRAFKELNYKILFDWERKTRKVGDTQDFWNGIYLVVVEK